MERELNTISQDLMWEYGPAVSGNGHRLVITPEAKMHLRPMVQTLIERARKLPGWEFYSYRLAEDAKMAEQTVSARAGGDISGTLAKAMIGQHNRISVAIGTNEGRWRAFHQDNRFYSERYSRHGEIFCYLKLDGSGGLDEEKFPDRASIEDALNETLIPKCVGCVIGGGTGLLYSYIDLALADVDAAVPLILSRLRAGNINRRTWLLFFDACLGDEWIGVYDDSPVPP